LVERKLPKLEVAGSTPVRRFSLPIPEPFAESAFYIRPVFGSEEGRHRRAAASGPGFLREVNDGLLALEGIPQLMQTSDAERAGALGLLKRCGKSSDARRPRRTWCSG
jgi:hypothetical protein